MKNGRKGESIILNGTSSSGKTSTAKELERILDYKYQHLSIDTYSQDWIKKNLNVIEKLEEKAGKLGKDNEEVVKELIELSKKSLAGYHDSIAQGMEQNSCYILDYVLWQPPALKEWIINDFLTKLTPYEFIFVGVYCPLHILNQRELERGDRIIGTAKEQFPSVHIGKEYDVEINTNLMSPYECALAIKEHMLTRDLSEEKRLSDKIHLKSK